MSDLWFVFENVLDLCDDFEDVGLSKHTQDLIT
jgi:hypothetical protein